jgi:hypothetical protein
MKIWGHRCGFMGQESGKESRCVDKGVGMWIRCGCRVEVWIRGQRCE